MPASDPTPGDGQEGSGTASVNWESLGRMMTARMLDEKRREANQALRRLSEGCRDGEVRVEQLRAVREAIEVLEGFVEEDLIRRGGIEDLKPYRRTVGRVPYGEMERVMEPPVREEGNDE